MDGYYEFAYYMFSTPYFMFPFVGAITLATLFPALFSIFKHLG